MIMYKNISRIETISATMDFIYLVIMHLSYRYLIYPRFSFSKSNNLNRSFSNSFCNHIVIYPLILSKSYNSLIKEGLKKLKSKD